MHQDNTVGTVIVFDIQSTDEKDFRAWLQANRDVGYVGNIPRKNGANPNDPLFLHTAGCPSWAPANDPFINEDFYKACATMTHPEFWRNS